MKITTKKKTVELAVYHRVDGKDLFGFLFQCIPVDNMSSIDYKYITIYAENKNRAVYEFDLIWSSEWYAVACYEELDMNYEKALQNYYISKTPSQKKRSKK